MSGGDGGTTAAEGTPVPVDTSVDRWARTAVVVLLAGPVIWTAHFLLVYTVAEAGCTGDGVGLQLLDPPVPVIATLVTTAVAALGCLGCALWGYRRWQAGRHVEAEAGETPEAPSRLGAMLDAVGAALSLLFAVSVLMVGLPAVWLSC